MRKLRLAVLVSGGGTNLQAMIDRAASGALSAEIVVVASDNADAYGLVRARDAGIPAHVVDYAAYRDRSRAGKLDEAPPVDLDALDRTQKILKYADREKRLAHLKWLTLAEREMIGVLEQYQPDYVCL